MIIDIHAHTSKHRMRQLHTESATIATLEAEAQRHGIETIVLMATYFPLKGKGVHNLDLLERIKGKPLFKAFGSLDVMNHLQAGLRELTKLAEGGGIAGIKLYPGYQGFGPNDSRLNPVYRLADRFNLPVMFHGGELHHCCSAFRRGEGSYPCGLSHCELDDYEIMAHPRYVASPAKKYPHVKFVVSHLANPHFAELRQVMQSCPNVFTDISGQFVSGSAEDTEKYRQAVVAEVRKFLLLPRGIERLMFGTDFPIQSYDDSLDLISRLDLEPADRERVLYHNAEWVLNREEVL